MSFDVEKEIYSPALPAFCDYLFPIVAFFISFYVILFFCVLYVAQIKRCAALY